MLWQLKEKGTSPRRLSRVCINVARGNEQGRKSAFSVWVAVTLPHGYRSLMNPFFISFAAIKVRFAILPLARNAGKRRSKQPELRFITLTTFHKCAFERICGSGVALREAPAEGKSYAKEKCQPTHWCCQPRVVLFLARILLPSSRILRFGIEHYTRCFGTQSSAIVRNEHRGRRPALPYQYEVGNLGKYWRCPCPFV